MATWKRNNDVGIGGIAEGGLSVPSTFGHNTAEEQQVRCPQYQDWSEKIEKVHGRSFSLLREPLRNWAMDAFSLCSAHGGWRCE
jgi:hypothetical protein